MDGTADFIVRILGDTGSEVFRWNIDLWADYEVCVSDGKFEIRDRAGRVIDLLKSDYSLLWRKPILSQIPQIPGRSDWGVIKGQFGSFLQAAVAHASNQGRVRLIEPFADKRLPKLIQLDLAQQLFEVPKWEFSTSESQFSNRSVAKFLSEMQLADGRILYSTLVQPNSLERPYPWFLQKPIIGGVDVTCTFILGEIRFWECDYVRNSENIDWRIEINTSNPGSWVEITDAVPDKLKVSVENFMGRAGLHYSRSDFIRDDEGTYWFLECNPNGQFGWLDDEDLSLHQAFVSAFQHSDSAVRADCLF